MATSRASILAALLAAALGLAASPAAHPQASQAGPTFPAKVELVVVDAVVLDREGQSVADLTRDDFTLKEDGIEQTVTSFHAEDMPIDIDIVLYVEQIIAQGDAMTIDALAE